MATSSGPALLDHELLDAARGGDERAFRQVV
jgi:hypothetical protein